MPDTIDNQKAYPQPSSQKAGCGREGGILSDLCNLKVILWRYSPLPAISQNHGFIQYHNWSSNRNNN